MDRISTIKTTLFISLFPMPLVSMGSAVGGNGLFEIAFLSRIGYLIERYIKKQRAESSSVHVTGDDYFPGASWINRGVRYV